MRMQACTTCYLSTVHAGALVACRSRHFRRSEFRVRSVFAMCVVCVVCIVCVGVRRVCGVRGVRGVRGELTDSTSGKRLDVQDVVAEKV